MVAVAFVLLAALPVAAQRVTYPQEEFAARRAALCDALDHGTVLLFGNSMPPAGVRPRQDNDFFYYTGVEDLHAALLLTAEGCAATLFLPQEGEQEVRADGANLLTKKTDAASLGFAAIRPLTLLEEHLAMLRSDGPVRLWVRLQEPDTVDNCGTEIGHLTMDVTRHFGRVDHQMRRRVSARSASSAINRRHPAGWLLYFRFVDAARTGRRATLDLVTCITRWSDLECER